ncbi:uncharacterized protein EV154DRAFT_492633 [Mucor mucedo]|uniref:uncharacterized protein n=1 Tax=Mucor mucedo TaxID=29922 RepID=UPI00221E99AE|nr:uncharacterized protein EV154DRAFT_492633 [Mucor mucedo]KAI7896184.1 hypothetical protein EV154DRAFT_492633 [Mucor mucedo]
MSATIQIKWHHKKFPIEFASIKDLEATTVKDLKTHIQRLTGLEPSSMKLQAFGAFMTNDELPLSVYGIRPGCFVKLIEHHKKDHGPPVPAKDHPKKAHHHHKEVRNEEQELIDKLQVLKTKVDTELAPQIKTYEKEVKAFLNKSEKTEKEKKAQIYKAAYLGEQLMLILFDLDAFSCGVHTNARQHRKELVQVTQALLDKVDEIKSVVKNIVL